MAENLVYFGKSATRARKNVLWLLGEGPCNVSEVRRTAGVVKSSV